MLSYHEIPFIYSEIQLACFCHNRYCHHSIFKFVQLVIINFTMINLSTERLLELLILLGIL